jgi:hypothetical protein
VRAGRSVDRSGRRVQPFRLVCAKNAEMSCVSMGGEAVEQGVPVGAAEVNHVVGHA